MCLQCLEIRSGHLQSQNIFEVLCYISNTHLNFSFYCITYIWFNRNCFKMSKVDALRRQACVLRNCWFQLPFFYAATVPFTRSYLFINSFNISEAALWIWHCFRLDPVQSLCGSSCSLKRQIKSNEIIANSDKCLGDNKTGKLSLSRFFVRA